VAIVVTRCDPGPENPAYRVWEDPANLRLLHDAWWLVARRGKSVVGTWLVPIETTESGPVARRRIRLLPYSSPRLGDLDPRRRRDVCRALLSWVQRETVGIELPLAPDFHDLGAMRELGGFIETRVTHLVDDLDGFLARQSPRCRNHINAARRRTLTHRHSEVSRFNFEAAIVSAPLDQVAERRELATALAMRGTCEVVEVTSEGDVVGQALVQRSGGYAIVMHSWHDRKSGIRGIPSLLIHEIVVSELGEGQSSMVDLEGSIIASIDAFMDGTGAKPAPYAFAYWYPDRKTLLQRLELSLDISGRVK
jgi:hypothetical protein